MKTDKDIIYPTAEDAIEFNILVLDKIKTKRADKSEVLSYKKIQDVIEGCKNLKGNIYDKAAYLLVNTIRQHAFASVNRRTAFILSKHFLVMNNAEFNIADDPGYAKIMTVVRENYYSMKEIKNWIQNGTIREFKRN